MMQSQLSNEDNLRLNVLLNQEVHSIRIDEGKMLLHGLTDKGEAKIKLSPNCRNDAYIRRVKEMISSHVLGSPGGYPVYIKRWTRMGHARDNSLENLLKLGEPEAVVAVVHSKGLTDELARRAWWAMASAENARRMLEKQAVAEGAMGRT
ncbi:MAG: sulfur reduction protein DsrS, partial [Gammaproteobacteria bacterium]|nr:sulfur reduction protein DsrS [Gammaproteobacteria bacterium]